MDYTFNYTDNDTSYSQVGFSSKEDVKQELLRIASIFYKKGKIAVGRVSRRTINERLETLEKFEVVYENESLRFKKK